MLASFMAALGLAFGMAFTLIMAPVFCRLFPKSAEYFITAMYVMPFAFAAAAASGALDGIFAQILFIASYLLFGIMLIIACAGCWVSYANECKETEDNG